VLHHLPLSSLHSAYPSAPYVLAHVPSLQFAQVLKAQIVRRATAAAQAAAEGGVAVQAAQMSVIARLPLVHVIHAGMSQFEVQSLLLSLHNHMRARSPMQLACNSHGNHIAPSLIGSRGDMSQDSTIVPSTGAYGASVSSLAAAVAADVTANAALATAPLLVLCVGDVLPYSSLFGHKSALFDATITKSHSLLHSHANHAHRAHVEAVVPSVSLALTRKADTSALDHNFCWRYLCSPDVVIDTGLQYLTWHDALTGQNIVKCVPISQNQAALRASLGSVVLRLYDTATAACLPRHYRALTRLELTPFLLRMYALGFSNANFDFFREHIPEDELMWSRGVLVKAGMLASAASKESGIVKFPEPKIPNSENHTITPLTSTHLELERLALTQRGVAAALLPAEPVQVRMHQ